MKKTLLSFGMAAVLGLAGVSASASTVNVGGVVWDPDAINAFPSFVDFAANGSVLETAVAPMIGDTVTGRGQINQLNSAVPNQASFCPGCQLTYTFSMDLAGITPISGDFASFSFTNLVIKFWVDSATAYTGSAASAGDGSLWLELTGHGLLTGTGLNIGTGSDTGSGSSLLDVTGGLAAGNFDTNTLLDGADMVFSSSFQPLLGSIENGRQILFGTADLKGNSIPEPGSLALLGLGLAGLGMLQRRRSQVK